MKIEKQIHYCWFGGKPLPASALKCIESWKKFCPDYKIIEWSETNYDVKANEYIEGAYQAKKYAFVSDYARFDILYRYGGIYLDVDVELIKPLDGLLDSAYFGFEDDKYVNAGLGFAAEKGNPLIGEICKDYENRKFIKPDGSFDYTTVVVIVTDLLKKKGLQTNGRNQFIEDIRILPSEYLQPIDPVTKKITITENTYSIHHYAASWYPPNRKVLKKLSELFGPRLTRIVKKLIRR